MEIGPPGALVPLSAELRRELFLVLKESLNNAIRHACPTEFSILIRCLPRSMKLSISDNGPGLAQPAPSGRGNGLGNMRARLARLHGEIEFLAAHSGGFLIQAKAPSHPADPLPVATRMQSEATSNEGTVFRFRPLRRVVCEVHMIIPSPFLRLLARGFLYKEIADQLGLSIGTVRTYVGRVYEKLQVHSRTEALLKVMPHATAGLR